MVGGCTAVPSSCTLAAFPAGEQCLPVHCQNNGPFFIALPSAGWPQVGSSVLEFVLFTIVNRGQGRKGSERGEACGCMIGSVQ